MLQLDVATGIVKSAELHKADVDVTDIGQAAALSQHGPSFVVSWLVQDCTALNKANSLTVAFAQEWALTSQMFPTLADSALLLWRHAVCMLFAMTILKINCARMLLRCERCKLS